VLWATAWLTCLDWAGYDVTREFYINDAGNQIQKFGKSLAIRYLQLYKGEEAVPLPEECYQGADIIARAKEFAEIHGDSYVDKDFEELKDALIADALPKNIAGLQRDLGKYRITYDVWFHESDLHKSGAVDDVIKILMDKGACYKAEDGAIMYRSAQYASKYGVVNRKKDEKRRRRRGSQRRSSGTRQRHSHLFCRRHRLPLQQAGRARF